MGVLNLVPVLFVLALVVLAMFGPDVVRTIESDSGAGVALAATVTLLTLGGMLVCGIVIAV